MDLTGSPTEADYSFAVNLMQFLVVPTFVLDHEGKVLIWNKALERLTGVLAVEVLGTREHWRAFYDTPRPCLADLIVQNRLAEIEALYTKTEDLTEQVFGVHVENWCVMPKLGHELYLAIDAGPIYGLSGNCSAVVETLRDISIQKKAQTALERLAYHDGLTGVVNRRGFDEKLSMEWDRALRDAAPLSLIMIDVDFFKRFNDSYGHQKGDECLKSVAEMLAKSVSRPHDVVSRYGGEEFAVILPSCEIQGAMAIGQRIQENIATLQIPHEASDASPVVTVSMGVSSIIPATDQQIDDIIGLADHALYRAKDAGRNRIEA